MNKESFVLNHSHVDDISSQFAISLGEYKVGQLIVYNEMKNEYIFKSMTGKWYSLTIEMIILLQRLQKVKGIQLCFINHMMRVMIINQFSQV